MITLVKGATVYTGDTSLAGDIVVENGLVAAIEPHGTRCNADIVDNAQGCIVVPGLVDTHVHFREPGITDTADIYSESRAAAAGGVTTFFDMPNNIPATTSIKAIEAKCHTARRKSLVNYSFFLGATADNLDEIKAADPRRVCGVKVFMGSSTGNMLVEGTDRLREIFAASPTPIVAHCEDMGIINRNTAEVRARYGDSAGVEWHSRIRNAEACYKSSSLAVGMARETGARLHVAHISSERELALFSPGDNAVTAEACMPHLVFCDKDYETLGARIKCNPAIKSAADRLALRQALCDGRISAVATDHAPHLPAAKRGGALKAASGMPSVQFSLVNMLELCDEGVLGIDQTVRLTACNPARIFGVERRGFLREGYYADFAILRKTNRYTLHDTDVVGKCGWTPYAGKQYSWRVEATYCNGKRVYSRENGFANEGNAMEISFRR